MILRGKKRIQSYRPPPPLPFSEDAAPRLSLAGLCFDGCRSTIYSQFCIPRQCHTLLRGGAALLSDVTPLRKIE